MVTIDYIIKRYSTFIANYNSLKQFQDKIKFENYTYEDLKYLKDNLSMIEDETNLISAFKDKIDLWLDIKKGAVHYPMINNYNYLSDVEKKRLDDFLYNNQNRTLDSKLFDDEKVIDDLCKDKIIKLYTDSFRCPVCNTKLYIRGENKQKCHLCGYICDSSSEEISHEFVVCRK